MTSKKPDEQHRANLKSRAIKTLSKTPNPSPSEKRSINLRKKLARGQAPVEVLDLDCRGCENKPTCEKNLNTCQVSAQTGRCYVCGRKFRYRFVFGEIYHCEECRSRRQA